MNSFKIAWRSIQQRGFGSLLTILSMGLGVTMVVAVLTIHGVVSQSFRANNSFGYNIIVGARGGGLQLTLNSVYYLSKPVENIPYEYYLAFCDKETRSRDLKNSIAYHAKQAVDETMALTALALPGSVGMGAALSDAIVKDAFDFQQTSAMKLNERGLYKRYTHIAVPLCQGDYYVDPETQLAFRCVGTTPNFFTDLVLDIDSNKKFQFAEGRNFVEKSDENGLFECVVGAVVASRCDIKIGDKLQATHGDPNSSSAHIHEQDYTVVGIIDGTGTPNDRVVFLNMEGFFLMEDHAKTIEKDGVLKTEDDLNNEAQDEPVLAPLDDSFFDDEGDPPATIENNPDAVVEPTPPETPQLSREEEFARKQNATRVPLPIEQREVTSILIRTSLSDEVGAIGYFLPGQINEGDLETTLNWTPYRPERSQKAAQAVNPVMEVASLFQVFVDPIRWMLLALTSMICIVSALSILVGIYNSMNQRKHEIAVMRALGANRVRVMNIILCESVLLALMGGLLGWVLGHSLNELLGSSVEDRTGVALGFFDFAPAVEISVLTLGIIPDSLISASVSPELLVIPGLMLLAVLVGIYPAISAYRTDVSKSLGK
ncbi:MAG: ABC transporter permease [Mariniblastus sp.]|nr:ABC transporter permease [Mariniblastus sp.]